jgi:predicted TIM-barrel fold metal-dependent hydrolase
MCYDPLMRILDAHVHAGRWKEPSFCGRESHVADVVRVMRASGVSGALVMPTDEGDNKGLLAAVRAEQTGFPLRFAFWADPALPGNLALLEAESGSVSAIKIHPSFLRRPITDPAFGPYLDVAGELALPVLVHCGNWREVAGFDKALAVAVARPGVSFILGHMGGDNPPLVKATIQALASGGPANAFLGTESIRQYDLVQEALDRLGPARLVFGSDHNLNHPRSFIAVIEALEASAEDKAMILGGNLERLVPGRF